jgi:hypothetical protein
MGYAVYRLRDHEEVTAPAGQCPSDVPVLQAFYERNFRRQGSFPILERAL